MKKILVGLSALGLFATVGAGCGDDTGAGGTGGAGGETTTGTTTGGMVTSTVTSSTGMMGDGNDTIDTATPMEDQMGGIYTFQDGELDPAETDVDFYSFPGVAGAYSIFGDAKPTGNEFGDGYLDLVISLYGPDKQLIARNDDPFPRNSQDSQLYTILPTNGTYYLKVEEFCEFDGNCPDPDTYFANLDPAYFVAVVPLDPSTNSVMDEAPEPNDLLLTATTMEYEPVDMVGDPGRYFLSIGYGEFSSAADVDAINFTVPADLAFEADARASATFVIPPPGTDAGNGSSMNPSFAEVIDPLTLGVVGRINLSAEKADPGRADLSLPVTPGGNYLFRLTGGPAEAGTLDPFYFVVHGVGGSNPIELEPNDSLVAPEVLAPAAMTDSYFVDGDLPILDSDFFQLATVSGTTLTVVCGAERSGSGVRGLTATVRNAANGNLIATGSETAAAQLLVQDINFGGIANVIVEMTKTSQDPGVSGNYYRCGYHFVAP